MNPTVDHSRCSIPSLREFLPVTSDELKIIVNLSPPTNYSNYRPVSNLVFLSKLIERVVVQRLNSHMDVNNMHESMQSGYKKQRPDYYIFKMTYRILLISTK